MIDLTTKYGPLTLKNPVMPGSSEIILDPRQVELAIKNGVGGIVTKSYVDELPPEIFPQTRPAWFPMRQFGTEFQNSWIFDSGACNKHPSSIVEKDLPKMAKLCKEAEIPLIVSTQCVSYEKYAYWSKKFEEAGADAVEFDRVS